MRLGFVLLIYIVGMSAASVSSIIQYDPIQTDFNITGTIKCHNAPQWCYTVQLLELDSTLNDVIGSVSGCEITNPSQDFLLEDWQLFDGVFDKCECTLAKFRTIGLIDHIQFSLKNSGINRRNVTLN
ncbi:Protein CBG00204 [Caenorhabditis briggsae]|uniref:Protein CBG00204 n=1 Tax=Caenorhabditis briggsae TaxID=6238 RepID=A8WMG8_CAEBR|nr:Protein CBG00204 [Caenorhabditis briggsae]CAP21673.2 Protein CBG00204 [Caenorhabditis briggsae]